jgi:hypothetical protein
MGKEAALRLLAGLGIVCGISAIALQASYTFPTQLAAGRSLPGTFVFFFSFFTILTNLLCIATFAAALGLPTGPLRFLKSHRAATGVLLAILLVAIVYHLLLAGLREMPAGEQFADLILHTMAPMLFALWWIMCPDHGGLNLQAPLIWALWPTGYLAYALARSPIAGEVPYPFLDYSTIGWIPVLTTILAIAAAFVIGGYVIVAIDTALSRSQRSLQT